jgi:hypothetical protein
MNTRVVFACGILTVAVLIGCGGSDTEEDKVMKETLSMMTQMVDAMEKAKPSNPQEAFKIMMDQMTKFGPKLKELDEKAKKWPQAKQDEMKKKYQSQIDALEARSKKIVGK